MRASLTLATPLLAIGCLVATASADTVLNGQPENTIDSYGFYYQVGGGLSPNGQTRNGDNATGGTIRYLVDDPAWGLPTGSWQKDDWFPVTSSIALTLKNGSSVVFDNNGIETNSVPTGYWDASQVAGSTTVGYGMSNNYDFIYVGLFQLSEQTTITSLTGYFLRPDPFGTPFDPADPGIGFRMNIFSEADNQLPAFTNSFDGDVFTSDDTAGTFSWSDTGYDRVTGAGSKDIYRLTYTLDAPITLEAGNYYFGSDATVTPVPVPSAALGGLALFGLAALRKARSRKSAD